MGIRHLGFSGLGFSKTTIALTLASSLLVLSIASNAVAQEPSISISAGSDEPSEQQANQGGQDNLTADPDLRSTAKPVQQAKPQVHEQEKYGRYLTDRQGLSLYMFAKDTQGGKSTCDQTCAIAWPAYASTQVPQAGEGLDAALLGIVEREDGTQQVTYNGWPLYYFSGDKNPGDALGQDVMHLGANWYLLSPKGEKITGSERSQAQDLQQDPASDSEPASQGQQAHRKIEDMSGQSGNQ